MEGVAPFHAFMPDFAILGSPIIRVLENAT